MPRARGQGSPSELQTLQVAGSELLDQIARRNEVLEQLRRRTKSLELESLHLPELQAQVEALQAHAAQLERERADGEIDQANMRKEIEEYVRLTGGLRSELTNLGAIVHALEDERIQLNEANTALQGERHRLSSELDQMRRTHELIYAQQATMDDERNALEDEMRQAGMQIAALQAGMETTGYRMLQALRRAIDRLAPYGSVRGRAFALAIRGAYYLQTRGLCAFVVRVLQPWCWLRRRSDAA